MLYLNKNIIDKFRHSISNDLKKAHIEITKIKNLKILYVGILRQLLALQKLFNRKVYCYEVN